jgi:hypothetical protein
MVKAVKKTVLPPNSAVVISMKQLAWISTVGNVAETLTQKIELSVVSKLTRKPIALVDVISRKDLTNEEKTFVRDVLKPRVGKIASTLMEMSFKLIMKDRMLQENSISEGELFEHYPNIPQWVVILNNSDQDVEIEIPEQFKLPAIVSTSLV